MVTGSAKRLEWARSLQAIAQSGLAYEPSIYDGERYIEIRRIAAEMLEDPRGDVAVDGIEALFAEQVGHATPKIDVRGAVFRGDAILLVKEAADDGWSLPGGWVDIGESPSEAVVREVLEESGYRTTATKLIALLDRDRHASPPHIWHIWKAMFICTLLDDDQARLGPETVTARFFTRPEVEGLQYSRASEWHIDRCFTHHAHPEFPTEFD